MLVVRTTEDATDPIGEFVGAKQTLGLYNLALAVDPFGFDRVESHGLCLGKRQLTILKLRLRLHCAFDLAVVRTEPTPDLLGDVPTRVVPEIRSKTFLPRASSLWQLHERN
jgi:hypothetical protein